MVFPIEFAKRSGDYDFFSPLINFTGNAGVIAVGGMSIGTISYFALKRLGFNKIAITAGTAIPTTIGAFGVAGVVLGGYIFVSLINEIFKPKKIF